MASCWKSAVQTAQFASDNNGNPLLVRPIFGVNSPFGNQEIFAEVAVPGDKVGTITISNTTQLYGAEANFLHECCCLPYCYRLDTLVGFRYLHLDEDLSIVDQFTQIPNPDFSGVNFNGGVVPTGSTLSRFDGFKTINNFYGGQVGRGSSTTMASASRTSKARWPSARPMRN